MVCKLKRSSTEWEKIFASYTSDKGLKTRMYRKLKKLYCPQINEAMKKWANVLNKTFLRKKSKWPKTHEKMLTIPGRKGNANQNHTKDSTSPLLEWLASRTPSTTNAGKVAGKKNLHTLLVGMQARTTTLENNKKVP
jgi:hypothetical protein